jgi:putative colanic acid biosysnthesis UDP-glucose lipid carrier transferase
MTQFTSLPTARYQIKSRQNYLRLLTDVLLICLSYLVASQISNRTPHLRDILFMGGLCISWYIVAKITALYNDFRTVTFVDEILALLPNVLFQFFLLSIFLFFLRDYAYARTFCVIFAGLLGVTILIKMYFARKLLQYWHRQGIFQKNIAIVGEAAGVSGFVKLIDSNVQFGYQIMGTWITRHLSQDNTSLGHTLQYLDGLFYQNHFEELVIVSDKFKENYVRGLIEWADKKGILVRFTPGFFQFSSSRYSLEIFGGLPLITVRSTPLEADQWWMLKQVFDFIFAGSFLVLIGSWLFPIIALAIKMDSKGPVFFVQKRLGIKGKEIKVWKFRTKYHQFSAKGHHGKSKETKNPSITTVGQFLCTTGLNKLPQLINVMLGEMSVVGPRPHAIEHSEEIAPLIENYMIRHRVKPGITGWAQVNGFNGETKILDLIRKRVDYDIWYIENWSFLLDLQILFRAIYNRWKSDRRGY